MLDPYFDALCSTALEHDGMIDAIAGDAVHIFFNISLERDDHVNSALDCARMIFCFAEEKSRRRGPPAFVAPGLAWKAARDRATLIA